jgi:hypothetical protein
VLKTRAVLLNLLKSEHVRGAPWYLREALYILIEAESPTPTTT